MDKTAIFMDGGYLDKVLELDFGKAAIDYGKLSTTSFYRFVMTALKLPDN